MKDGKNAYEAYKRLNPVYSGLDPDRYVAEPYVTPGNIDGPDSPNYGMAGWTWYSGSASWFQKVITDWILGVRSTEEGLIVDPCIPEDWKEYSVKRLFRGTVYNIKVLNPDNVSSGVKSVVVDGVEQQGSVIIPSGKEISNVTVILGK